MVTIITDVRVPADAFPLGRVLQHHPDVEIELERIVPTREGIVPLFWVESESESEDAVEETLRTDPLVEELVRLTGTPDGILYSVEWSPDVDSLVRALVSNGVDLLSGEGTADHWDLRLQFRNRTDLNRFRRATQEREIDLELRELFNPLMPSEKGPLTPEEKDALATAYENGYWDRPRNVTQAELAALVGVADSTLSRRLRGGVKRVVGELLFGPGRHPFE